MPFSVPLDIQSSDPRAASFTWIYWQHSRLIWNAALRLYRTGQLGYLRAASLHFPVRSAVAMQAVESIQL